MQGFAELEYGMLRYMGAIDDSTLIVTSGCVTTLLQSYFVVSRIFSIIFSNNMFCYII